MSRIPQAPDLTFAMLTPGESLDWQPAPRSLTTSFDGTHVWRFALSQSAGDLPATLSIDERGRAERFKDAIARQRFVVGREMLRSILSRYLETPPAKIEFAYGAHGKPELAAHPSLQFNLSHSHDLALLAVRCGRPVGIDVERLDASVDHAAIAAESFTVEDARRVATASPAERAAIFFRLWTRREASLKAIGVGLAGASASERQAPEETHTFSPISNFIASVALR